MNRYKIIATDLDGTLFDSQKRVSPENRAAIREITKRGIAVVPSSGRTLSEMPREVLSIPEARYIIHSDGAVIYDNHAKKPLDSRLMEGECAHRLIRILSEYQTLLTVRANGIIYVDADEQNEKTYDSYRMPRSYQPAMLNYATPVKDIWSFCLSLDEIEMICPFFKSDEELTACRERLYATGDYGISATEKTNLEIYDKDAGKGNALLRLAALLGASKEETIAVGDNDNDIDNLTHAGLALAMEKASENAKAVAHRIICHNDEHAMHYILTHII